MHIFILELCLSNVWALKVHNQCFELNYYIDIIKCTLKWRTTYSKRIIYIHIYISYSIFIYINFLNNSPNNIGNYLITHVELHLCLNLPIPSSRIRNRYNMPTSKLTSVYKTFYGNMSRKFSIHNDNKSCHISSNDR